MPWLEVDRMSSRREFVVLASVAGANIAELCRHFNISRKTGYKLLRRAKAVRPCDINTALHDHSRRPHSSPRRTPLAIEQTIVKARQRHPAWGARKIRKLLSSSCPSLPSPSTITQIFHRYQLIDPQQSLLHRPYIRFERPAPNQLWQMDFKGHFGLVNGQRCHALTVLDDHSRFNILLRACSDQKAATVQLALVGAFQRYGLPDQMLMDNGSPWGNDIDTPYTIFNVWLLQLGIAIVHGRPFHPQTQGKEERFHRTLELEVLRNRRFADYPAVQAVFDPWRDCYNCERPHEALSLDVPASRYRRSQREFSELLPPIEYPSGDVVRAVCQQGYISFKGHLYDLSRAFRGKPVALRATSTDGLWDVYFCRFRIAQLDQRTKTVNTRLSYRDHFDSVNASGKTDTGSAGEQPAKG